MAHADRLRHSSATTAKRSNLAWHLLLLLWTSTNQQVASCDDSSSALTGPLRLSMDLLLTGAQKCGSLQNNGSI